MTDSAPFMVMFLDMAGGRVSGALGIPVRSTAVVATRTATRQEALTTCVNLAQHASQVDGLTGSAVEPASNGARLLHDGEPVATWYVVDEDSAGFQVRLPGNQIVQESFATFEQAIVAAQQIVNAQVQDTPNASIETNGGVVEAFVSDQVVATAVVEPIVSTRAGGAAASPAAVLTRNDAVQHVEGMVQLLEVALRDLQSRAGAAKTGDVDIEKLSLAATAIGAANSRLVAASQLLMEATET